MKKVSVVFIFSMLLVLLGGFFVYEYGRFNDERLHLVFCDVGQGDAIFIRTPGGSDILVDGGPDDKVLSCLANNMPFWDKTLELVILTHPHADHLNGLISVLSNYKVVTFATEDLRNTTSSFKSLFERLRENNIPILYVYMGDRFAQDDVNIEIVGPSREFLLKTSPNGFTKESREFASVISLIKFKNFSAVLTGDSQASELKEAIAAGGLEDIDVLQVPHHGSKTGLTAEILETLAPERAVISVGKNRYGHPSPQILKILRDKDIKILRTDKDGEIEIVSGGN